MVYILGMEIPVSEAKGRLTDLVRRAEAGEDVVLTRHGLPAARLVRARQIPTDPAERGAIIDRVVRGVRGKIMPGPDAARSQDFLYDEETGLPK
jgi:prevent-host-death family protein